MALSPRLELKQTQGLVMTPQLQQAIKLLQLSNIELEAYVAAEMERNPLLDWDDGNARDQRDDHPHADTDSATDRSPTATQGPEAGLDLREDAPAAGATDTLDTDYENLYDGDSGSDTAHEPASQPSLTGESWANAGGEGRGGSFELREFNFDEMVGAEISLRDHLIEQLHLATGNPQHQLIGVQLIDSLDEAGYLREPLTELAARIGCTLPDAETVLEILQQFEPTGVFARDLVECLALQLRERNRCDPAMQALLDNLALLAQRDKDALIQLCGVDAEDLSDMIAELRALNPKPGLSFGGAPVQPIVPDVFVQRANDGSWKVELNNATLPRVLVNAQYCASIDTRHAKPEERQYISECLSNANWLVKSLAQRARTILKVSSEIVKQQHGFFEHGVSHLKPLNLRTVAEAIDMHESTVSRVTANKYVATSRGIYEMKYFFTASIASSRGGDAHSAESVRHQIKTLIDGEAPDKILSDDKLVALLRAQGIDIARRTVAKYREAMRIPSSVQRRREKRLSA
ncbi:MAG TPA: RNA polymerase sigma-54 factor [Alphaproteobacteria bacterium]|nr:RNA polymerase sigma-54 factor [Alphaproteobacteria bacterium]